jgi:hypothetical protein
MKKIFFPASIFFLVSAFVSSVQAQSITITSPLQSLTVKEGDDYATDVLNNPWDFNERRDIGWEQNFKGTSISVNNGIWHGENEIIGGHVFPLFPGFKNSLFSEGLPGDRKLPRFGINHRVNSSKYYHLSYRLNHTHRTAFAIYWEADESRPEYWPDPNSPRGASFDGYYHNSVPFENSGFTYYSFNMKNINSIFEQKQGSWSGNPYVLRIDPSLAGGVGAKTEIDWIRLVDPTSAPDLTITWSSSGIPSTAIITVYYDTNSSGYNGTPMRRFTYGNNPGTFTFPTATLPPGTYRFYVTAQNVSGSNFVGAPVVSQYSAPLTIVQKPSVYITSPSMTSGEEYSSDVMGQPWNMTEAGDLPNLDYTVWPDTFRQFTSPSFMQTGEAEKGGKVFAAMADPPLPGSAESDVQLHLRVSNVDPIDTGKFRYLTYRVKVDESLYPTIHDKIALGWVMRPIWWNNQFTLNSHHRAKAHILYEGWNTYGTDLADPSIMEYGSPWTNFSSFNNFRLDPLETPTYTWFYLDYVRLHAENRAAAGSFTISYVVSNPSGGPVTTRLYYTTSKSSPQKTLITTRTNQHPGSHSYTWDTSGLPTEASYYVFAEVDNGVSKSHAYSPVHVRIGPYSPQPRSINPEFDFDGDGISDQVVYRRASGHYFMNKSAKGYQQIPWGNAAFTPIYGDFDGDGIADRGLVVNISGFLYWYIIRSSDGLLYSRSWGLNGDKIVIGDYNGNGIDEIAVYREGAWFILDEDDRPVVKYWGLPGSDIPVPADYDGDGKTDLAIYRKSDGMWWILYSGFENGFADDYYAAKQWGLPWVGDLPVAADYTGDGKTDIAVWRPGLGMWFVRSLVDDSVTMQQWGLPGDVPLAGHDGNGDGVKGFTVYRPSIGTWFYNNRNGSVNGVQFGLPIDLLPVKTTR